MLCDTEGISCNQESAGGWRAGQEYLWLRWHTPTRFTQRISIQGRSFLRPVFVVAAQRGTSFLYLGSFIVVEEQVLRKVGTRNRGLIG